MGMFDYISIDKSIIDNLVPDADWRTSISAKDNLYVFQTKDLELCLNEYYIQADHYLYVKSYCLDKDSSKIRQTSLQREEKTTCNVRFYDIFNTKLHQVQVTFEAQIVDGKLWEICLVSQKEELLTDIQARNDKIRKKWELMEQQWEMKVYVTMCKFEYFIYNLFYKLTSCWRNYKTSLREKADAKVELIVQKHNTI
jgi:hypothetical protein